MSDRSLAPMLASSGELPDDAERWQFEFKWDGIRLVVDIVDQGLVCWSRNLNDLTASWPELAGLPDDFGGRRAVLDGEVVVMGEGGRPDFGLLQRRLHVRDGALAARLANELPATYLIFDLLELDGHDLRSLPLLERRRVLESLELDGPAWKVPPAFVGAGVETLESARRLQLEGIVAKRTDSRYFPGRRSPNWRKLKLLLRDEFVVLGYTPGDGARAGRVGSLYVGVVDGPGWRGTGSVGTGFDETALSWFTDQLHPDEIAEPAWSDGPIRPDVRPVTPRLVVEVAYAGWTRDGALRHPAYVALRSDRWAEDVEAPAGAPW